MMSEQQTKWRVDDDDDNADEQNHAGGDEQTVEYRLEYRIAVRLVLVDLLQSLRRLAVVSVHAIVLQQSHHFLEHRVLAPTTQPFAPPGRRHRRRRHVVHCRRRRVRRPGRWTADPANHLGAAERHERRLAAVHAAWNSVDLDHGSQTSRVDVDVEFGVRRRQKWALSMLVRRSQLFDLLRSPRAHRLIVRGARCTAGKVDRQRRRRAPASTSLSPSTSTPGTCFAINSTSKQKLGHCDRYWYSRLGAAPVIRPTHRYAYVISSVGDIGPYSTRPTTTGCCGCSAKRWRHGELWEPVPRVVRHNDSGTAAAAAAEWVNASIKHALHLQHHMIVARCLWLVLLFNRDNRTIINFRSIFVSALKLLLELFLIAINSLPLRQQQHTYKCLCVLKLSGLLL